MSTRTAGLLASVGATIPVVAAPMAGGPSRPELVLAAAAAGGVGFLAAGYKSPEDLRVQIQQVQRATPRFGVNLFVPNQVPIEPAELDRHRAAVQRWLSDHARTGGDWAGEVELPEINSLAGVIRATGAPAVDEAPAVTAAPAEVWDDFWEQKLQVLEADPAPLISLTFGLPSARDLARLQATGARVLQTVTCVAEAESAARAGVDGLIVQCSSAGGHSGTWTPRKPPAEVGLLELLHAISSRTELPLWAAGGIADAAGVRAALHAGAQAAVLGTALLRCPESGTHPAHQQALADPPGVPETTLTTAFSGRPARALRNSFTDALTTSAPSGFPALHQLSAGLRRAAGAAADPHGLNLWAGTGFAAARPDPAGEVMRRLAGDHRV
ncbi:nitronate monooxygenase [Nesterenkonia sandarakina]|uniref:Propionate 3-nitronate monooxygenase n=1 Tax=Nesterenkonia sandarakina TaxID=272918 RepID=A0A7Z0E9Z4_9MICC|nr:nitronate monooxygenase [Nesterenkonia sandarakina]NYJ17775.1 NAD(P)H-dependent flavin oxidoreductase YrpB (nitropropane dioxygenase family) [Nesterenkonia sandarakina]